jgi:putative sigma-54 modulation protein
MDIAIRGRNIEVSEPLRRAVTEKVARQGRYVGGMERAEVLFSEERNPRISEREVCEVTMWGHGHIVRARAAGADPFAALDRVIDKLEHRVEKLKGKLIGRSHPRRHGSLDFGTDRTAADEDEADDGGDGRSRIVKTKAFHIKPMTPEEAALEMDLLGHDFFFFTNAESNKAAVVYRRNDGHVGLIDATS